MFNLPITSKHLPIAISSVNYTLITLFYQCKFDTNWNIQFHYSSSQINDLTGPIVRKLEIPISNYPI